MSTTSIKNKNSKNKEIQSFIKAEYTDVERTNIACAIKNISEDTVCEEMSKLIQIGENACNMSPRSRIGNNIVDFFTFSERLKTIGKYNINFYDFIVNLDTSFLYY